MRLPWSIINVATCAMHLVVAAIALVLGVGHVNIRMVFSINVVNVIITHQTAGVVAAATLLAHMLFVGC